MLSQDVKTLHTLIKKNDVSINKSHFFPDNSSLLLLTHLEDIHKRKINHQLVIAKMFKMHLNQKNPLLKCQKSILNFVLVF